MRRLYLQIYLAFLGILIMFAALLALAWWLLPDDTDHRRYLDGLAALLADSLPAGTQRAELQSRLQELATRFQADVTLRAADGALLAAAGEELRAAPPRWTGSAWLRGPRGRKLALRFPDGRWLMVRFQHPRRPTGLLMALVLLAVAVAVGAYPLARRVTRRLERLQARVEALGAGDLQARVDVEGRDEVAELARSFNHAAGRIERLVGGHKSLLAHVSHELRTPLARMRMAVELLPGNDRPELRARLDKDIGELDTLIGELLLASRMDALEGLTQVEEIDVLALAAEEAAHHGGEVSGTPVSVYGDARLLRRLLRNLLQNAHRYAEGTPVEVNVQPGASGGALLRVADRGPGIPESERERIFEPFYRLPGTAESGEGVGLGLALVRQIAQRHGGTAHCLAREGGGTVFEVELASRP